jgi:predicted nucleic acid-binding Zn ribbon protein
LARPAAESRPTVKKLVPAGDLVRDLLGRAGFDARAVAVFEAWDRLLGSEAAKARATGFQRGRLIVEVDSHPRLHDLTFRKRSLLQKLNGHFGPTGTVSDILFRYGASRR